MKQKFIEKFKEAIEVQVRELSLEDEFRNYNEWDSLALLSVIAMIDEEYNVIIDNKKFQELKTIGDIYEYINSKKQV